MDLDILCIPYDCCINAGMEVIIIILACLVIGRITALSLITNSTHANRAAWCAWGELLSVRPHGWWMFSTFIVQFQ